MAILLPHRRSLLPLQLSSLHHQYLCCCRHHAQHQIEFAEIIAAPPAASLKSLTATTCSLYHLAASLNHPQPPSKSAASPPPAASPSLLPPPGSSTENLWPSRPFLLHLPCFNQGRASGAVHPQLHPVISVFCPPLSLCSAAAPPARSFHTATLLRHCPPPSAFFLPLLGPRHRRGPFPVSASSLHPPCLSIFFWQSSVVLGQSKLLRRQLF